jgi:hypothetical protein
MFIKTLSKVRKKVLNKQPVVRLLPEVAVDRRTKDLVTKAFSKKISTNGLVSLPPCFSVPILMYTA